MLPLRLSLKAREGMEVFAVLFVQNDCLAALLAGNQCAGLDRLIQTGASARVNLEEFFNGVCVLQNGDSQFKESPRQRNGDSRKTEAALPRLVF